MTHLARHLISASVLGAFVVLAFGSDSGPQEMPSASFGGPSALTKDQNATLTFTLEGQADAPVQVTGVRFGDDLLDRVEIVSTNPATVSKSADTTGLSRTETWEIQPLTVPAKGGGTATFTMEVMPRVPSDGPISLAVSFDSSKGWARLMDSVSIGGGDPVELIEVVADAPTEVTGAAPGSLSVRILNNGLRERRLTKLEISKGYGEKTSVYPDFDPGVDRSMRSDDPVVNLEERIPAQSEKTFTFTVEAHESGTARGEIDAHFDDSMFEEADATIETRVVK